MKIEGIDFTFTSNIEFALNKYLKENNMLKKDGNPYKYVDINHSYNFNGVIITKLVAKSELMMFSSNAVPVSVSSITGKHDRIKLNNELINSVTISDNEITTINKTINIGKQKDTSTNIDPKLAQYLMRNNCESLKLVMNKYYNIVTKVRNKKILGYCDINRYFKLIKDFIPLKSTSVNTIDEYITINSIDNKIRVFETNGIIEISGITLNRNKTQNIVPYVIITNKPTNIRNKILPYKAVSYKNLILYVAPFGVNETTFLKDMRGSVNLLS